MNDSISPVSDPAEPSQAGGTPGVAGADSKAQPEKKEESFFVFLLKLIVIVLVFRSFVFAPFTIPSESMLPGLKIGDYLLASKWSYGYSRYSLPLSLPLIPGRILSSQPQPGDVVIIKAPPLNNTDYIKRVIGLPGDTIQMIDGVLHINGTAVPKVKVADFVTPITANMTAAAKADGGHPCTYAVFEVTLPGGDFACRYPRYRETLPNGKSYYVLDFGVMPQDNTPPTIVPEGSLFLMGDNRDNSMDSRFPAVPNGGIGIVPQENLVGKAQIMMFSTDGSASWLKPWTWFTAARWSRIGTTF